MNCSAFCPLVPLPTAHVEASISRHSSASLPNTVYRRPRALTCTLSLPRNLDASSAEPHSSQTYNDALKVSKNKVRPTELPPLSRSSEPSSPHLSPPPPPPPPNRSPDFHANVGTVIDTLRADYPHLLTHPPDFHIYRDDVVISDSTGYRLTGKDAYRTVLFLLRAHAKLFLTAASLHIVSMFYHDDNRPAVHVRWRMRSTPRVWAPTRSDSPVILDGLSVYYLDSSGWIYHHTFESKVRNGRKPARVVFERVPAVGRPVIDTGCAPVHFPNNNASNYQEISLDISQLSES